MPLKTKTAANDNCLPDFHEFLIDDILPANEVHLIAAASGAGKSRFIFQYILSPYIKGQKVLGHDVKSVPYCYVSIDRSHAGVLRTLEQLGLDKEILNIVPMERIPNDQINVPAIIRIVKKLYPETRFIIIEGFQLINATDTRIKNEYARIGMALREATMLCGKHKITILGVCHAPKLKENESFQNPREYVAGSMGWAAYSDTTIVMIRNKKTGVVTAEVMPRNAKEETYNFRFGQDGKLEPVGSLNKSGSVTQYIVDLSAGTSIMRADLVVYAEKNFEAGKTVVDDVLKALTTNGVLDKLASPPGCYVRTGRPNLKVADVVNGDFEIEVDENL